MVIFVKSGKKESSHVTIEKYFVTALTTASRPCIKLIQRVEKTGPHTVDSSRDRVPPHA
jgi:hypothetical protein